MDEAREVQMMMELLALVVVLGLGATGLFFFGIAIGRQYERMFPRRKE